MARKNKRSAEELLADLATIARRENSPEIEMRQRIMNTLPKGYYTAEISSPLWPFGILAGFSGLTAIISGMLSIETFEAIFNPLSMIFEVYPPNPW